MRRHGPESGLVCRPASHLDLDACDRVMAWDLNYSEKDSSDWTVAVVGAVERTVQPATIHVLDVYAAHLAESRHDVELADYIASGGQC
jgi:hypothetical protein